METAEAYLARKHEELSLMNGCLRNPPPLRRPQSVAEVIRHKFQLAAALKAEHAWHDWTATETSWAHSAQRNSGPFSFSYDYQRADLDVKGPSFYELGDDVTAETVYTASGMAAISALLLASSQVIEKGQLLVSPGSYGETQELIEGHVRHLRRVTLKGEPKEDLVQDFSVRFLMLDSSAPICELEAALNGIDSALDLLIFDTTCFCGSSSHIRRVINRANERNVPVVMVRSHTKLDSLGAEYGRLGSVTFIHRDKSASWASGARLNGLPVHVRTAIRLLGGAAVPAHFPPYVAQPAYRELTRRRQAAILRNSRHARRYFRAALPGSVEDAHFAHGLYLTLKGATRFDETLARRAAAGLSDDLERAGFPIRHAGSFGFDFAATEWFCNPATGRYSVRVAVPDLPTSLWNDLVASIAKWWSERCGSYIAA